MEDNETLDGAARIFFELNYLFPYQRLVIGNILEAAAAENIAVKWPGGGEESRAGSGRDEEAGELGRQIVILPTGAGKSLCFQLPAMLLKGPTLVIYPILSLMADQERRLAERGVVHGINMTPVILRGEQSPAERRTIYGKIRNGESRFILANPEVLLTDSVMRELPSLGIVHIVIDEAHCAAEWGESFRPAYLEIRKIVEASAAKIITAFTATASLPVLEKIEKYIFSGEGAHKIIGNPNRMNIHYSARGVILRDAAVRDLLEKKELPALVFCSSRRATEKLARYLKEEFSPNDNGSGVKGPSPQDPSPRGPLPGEVRFYHAGLGREEKRTVEAWVLRNPRAVLVATCAFGMGVDKADIRTVIHRDPPPSVEAYLQESGRAGRDGKQSEAILFWGPDDKQRFERMRADEQRRFGKLLAYARDTRHCRREALQNLLDYEGENEKPEGSCCDVCDSPGSVAPDGVSFTDGVSFADKDVLFNDGGLREEASFLDFFKRNKRCYTVNEAAEHLIELSGMRLREAEIKQALAYLISRGKLKKMKGPFWKDKLKCSRKKC